MTLSEWSEKTGEPIQDCKGCAYVVCSLTNPLRPELWHLDDYAVSSVSSLTVYLVPAKKAQ